MNKKTIMIVDDNPDAQYILGLALKGSGYSVVHVMNGYDALIRVREGDINLVVSDILMPGMDGFQLCWEIKSNEKTRNIPFVFYTAYYTGKADESFAMKLGAQKFICKPTDPDEFVEKIKQVIHECENSKLLPHTCTYHNADTFLKEYVDRLKGSIERNILGMNGSKPVEVEDQKTISKVSPDQKETEKKMQNSEMGSYEDIIITALSSSSGGFTTNRLAKITGISRTTSIKYLSVLKERGVADYVMVGPSKLWFLKTVEKAGPSS